MRVIGIAGQAQMGKDTVADQLALRLNEGKPFLDDLAGLTWQRIAFAAGVKKVYKDIFNVDDEFIEKWKVIPEPPPGFEMTVRQSLQFIGDGFRKIQPNIWLDLAFRNVTGPSIISDVRYINELKRVKSEGDLNILVIRPEKLTNDPNGSEAQIRPYIQWVLNYFGTDRKFIDLTNFDYAWVEAQGPASGDPPNSTPEYMNQIDVAIINDGTKEDVHKIVDEQLVPFVQNFKFK